MNKKRNQITKFHYIFLSIFHIFLLFFVFYKRKDRKTVFFTLLSNIALAFYFEYPLYVLKAYKYKTNLIKNKEQDNTLGSILSQGLFVPSVGMFISFFQLGWKTKCLFTMYFIFIERLFIKLTIYKNRWWRTTYTMLSIFSYFFISDALYKGMVNRNKFVLKMTQYNAFHVIYMNLLFLLSIFKKFRFQPVKMTTKPWYYHYSFVKVYLVIETILTIYFFEQKTTALKALPLLITLITDITFRKLNYLRVKGHYWIYIFPVRFLSYLSLYLFQGKAIIEHDRNLKRSE